MDPTFLTGFKGALLELRPQTKSSRLLVLVSVLGTTGLIAKYFTDQKAGKASEKASAEEAKEIKGSNARKKSTAVDLVFFKRLVKIFRIVLGPKEVIIFVILTFLLFARTMLSVSIAEILGKNAQFLVSRDWKRMWRGILRFAIITIPASVVNAGLKYFSALLALHFRVKLSQHVHNEYIKDVNFYKACNLGGEERIENADQRVTADIAKFSESIAELYTTLFKPILDVVLFTAKLNEVTGWQAPAVMYSYFFLSGIIKRSVMPSFGRLVAKESELEGVYRTAHQRLIINSEEIAFYDGSKREKNLINSSLASLEKHILIARYLKGLVGVFDGLLVKYWASIAGYIALSLPIVLGAKGSNSLSTEELTRDYIRNGQYLGNLSGAVGDLVLVGNKLMNIAGFTSRVSELLEQVNKLSSYGNTPFTIRDEDNEKVDKRDTSKDEANFDEEAWIQEWKNRQDAIRQKRIERSSKLNKKKQVVGGGVYEEGDRIEFKSVDLVSPEGKLLIHDLSICVERNQHVMITGPNGAGKSSLFRIIGELWPLHNGVVVKPAKEDILFVPQKPYLVMGTLRDQIIYPHSIEQMQALGVTDEDLEHLLKIVDPSGIILNNWKWDDVKDWFVAFSGGQKQRVAMARLFYHRPLFSILDECTSAVSDEVEDKIYETCTKLGITLFTVSHRSYLRRYHEYILRVEGRNGLWEWSKIPESERKKF